MKKSYIYMLVPVLGVIIFCCFYIPFSNHYEARQLAQHKLELKEKNDKLKAQAEAQLQAAIKANQEADRRKHEREARQAAQKVREEARTQAQANEQVVFNDQEKYKHQAEDLQRQIDDETAAMARIANDRQNALKEQEFLKTDVAKAEANVSSIASLLDKLAAAEKARADAAALAAKKASNS
jgi:colicin import membrane protein